MYSTDMLVPFIIDLSLSCLKVTMWHNNNFIVSRNYENYDRHN